MKRSIAVRSPVLSFLSSSPSLSRRTQDLLSTSLFSFKPLSLESLFRNDALDELFASKVPGVGKQWDSIGSQCQKSGTIIHFLSLRSSNQTIDVSERDANELHSLLAVTADRNDDSPAEVAIQRLRDSIANELTSKPYGSCSKIALSHSAGRPILASHLFTFGGGLPLIELPLGHTESQLTECSRGLKEVCIPHYDDVTYQDGSTLLSNGWRLPVSAQWSGTTSASCRCARSILDKTLTNFSLSRP